MSQGPPSPRRGQPAYVIGGLLLVVLLYLAFQQLSGGMARPSEQPDESAATVTQANTLPAEAPAAEAPASDTSQPQESVQESVAQPPTDTPLPEEATPTQQPQPPPTATYAAKSELPLILYAELPPEAHETIALIDAGGPFPYSKDGSTFQNREGILPKEPQGYYSEYTVETPGSPDRGARRIVAGDDGELYYTDDHYASFSEIVR